MPEKKDKKETIIEEIKKASRDETLKKDLEYQREKDKEMVRGVFKFYEVPGGTLGFVYRKYKDEQVKRYDMADGEIYTIPLGVAKHLNKSGWYPVHAHAFENDDVAGKAIVKIGKKIRRYGFQSLEFIDIASIGEAGESSILTAEKV